MKKFDVYQIGPELYLVVQADHLLDLNSIVLVPLLPADGQPALSRLTVEVRVDGGIYRVQAHMPLTVSGTRLRAMTPVARLTPDEGQKVMDGLNTILWGF
jgi:hypothetical protein